MRVCVHVHAYTQIALMRSSNVPVSQHKTLMAAQNDGFDLSSLRCLRYILFNKADDTFQLFSAY